MISNLGKGFDFYLVDDSNKSLDDTEIRWSY